MQPNWDYPKKTTLWHYEGLIKKLLLLTAYPVIWQVYNNDMTQAAVFARRMFPEKNMETGEFPARMLSIFKRLNSAGISDWGNLLSKVTTRAECVTFITEHNLKFEGVIV